MRFKFIAYRVAPVVLGLCIGFGPFGHDRAPGMLSSQADAATEKKPPRKSSAKSSKASKSSTAKDAAATGKAVKNPGVWGYGRDDEAFVLQYGVPGAPAPVLVATCRPGAGLFQVVAEVSPPKAQTGDPVRLVLTNGKVAVEFAASVFPSAVEGRRAVEAQVTLEPKLVELFKQGDQLKIAVPGVNELLPLAGAQRRVPDFEKGCLKAKIVPASSKSR